MQALMSVTFIQGNLDCMELQLAAHRVKKGNRGFFMQIQKPKQNRQPRPQRQGKVYTNAKVVEAGHRLIDRARMTWTTTKPTDPGWYWMQEETAAEPIIIQVVPDTVRLLSLVMLVPMARPLDCGYAADLGLTDTAKWAGPLLPPKCL